MERLILHLEDLKRSLSGVGGLLYFELGDEFVPAYRWRECVTAAWDVWIPVFVSFVQGHTDTCRLPFMDGPYCVKLYRDRDGGVLASFYRDSREVIPPTEIDLRMLIRSVAGCLRTYERLIHEWGMSPVFGRELCALNRILKQD